MNQEVAVPAWAVISIVRYAIGRMTYVVSDTAELVCGLWPSLDERVREIVRRDVEEEFERDDRDRAEGKSYKALGMDCDRRSWERVRALWRPSGEAGLLQGRGGAE